MIVKYVKTDPEGRRVLEVVSKNINVFRFIYDHVAERALRGREKIEKRREKPWARGFLSARCLEFSKSRD